MTEACVSTCLSAQLDVHRLGDGGDVAVLALQREEHRVEHGARASDEGEHVGHLAQPRELDLEREVLDDEPREHDGDVEQHGLQRVEAQEVRELLAAHHHEEEREEDDERGEAVAVVRLPGGPHNRVSETETGAKTLYLELKECEPSTHSLDSFAPLRAARQQLPP